MIYMESVFTVQPAKMAAAIQALRDLNAVFEKAGVGGKAIGAWQTQIGKVGELTVLTAYDDLVQFQKVTGAMAQNKDWQTITARLQEVSVALSRKIMAPLPDSPLK